MIALLILVVLVLAFCVLAVLWVRGKRWADEAFIGLCAVSVALPIVVWLA